MTDEISSGAMKQVNCKFSHFAFIVEFIRRHENRTSDNFDRVYQRMLRQYKLYSERPCNTFAVRSHKIKLLDGITAIYQIDQLCIYKI